MVHEENWSRPTPKVNPSSTQRNRVRHPQLGPLVEDVAGGEDLVALCNFVSSGQSTTEALLVPVEGVLRPGLMVLSSLQTPTATPHLTDAFNVCISVAQDKFPRDDRISPGWDDRCSASFSSRFVDFTTVVTAISSDAFHWVRHLLLCRDLQRETGGFTEFVGLPFVHMAAPIYLQHRARRGPTFRETLLVHAVARIAYGDLIPNVQASWVKIGNDGVRQLLQAGVNDLGGTLVDENISRAAGAEHGQMMTEPQMRALVEPLGRSLEQRTTLYDRVQGGTRLHVTAPEEGRIPIPVTSA